MKHCSKRSQSMRTFSESTESYSSRSILNSCAARVDSQRPIKTTSLSCSTARSRSTVSSTGMDRTATKYHRSPRAKSLTSSVTSMETFSTKSILRRPRRNRFGTSSENASNTFNRSSKSSTRCTDEYPSRITTTTCRTLKQTS